MRIVETKPLFAWDCLEDSPSLRTVREFLAAVPDGRLLDSLRAWRGRGRDDYPVHVLWGTVLLVSLLRHSTIEGCLGELQRNASLRRLIGIEPAYAITADNATSSKRSDAGWGCCGWGFGPPPPSTETRPDQVERREQ